MKYEITKGSEKDFEGAPEWCTHVIISDASNKLAYESSDRAVKGNPWAWVGDEVVSKYDQFVSGRVFTHIIAERRPITEPVWDGEGLPPAGVECEVRGCIGDYREWKKVTVFAVRDKTVFFDYDGGWAATANHEFRPIRSPEDVARDEAISEMLMVEGGMPDAYQPHELVAALYDAGYRKME